MVDVEFFNWNVEFFGAFDKVELVKMFEINMF